MTGVGLRPLDVRPAVVRSHAAVVDFLPGTLPDVVDEHATGAALETEGEGIAQAERPDRAIVTGRGGEERIARRDRSGGVDAQDLAEQVGESLRVRAVA